MTSTTSYCSFCGISEHETAVLIAAPASIFICDGCVSLCGEVVEGHRTKRLALNGHREMFWGDIGINPMLAQGWCR